LDRLPYFIWGEAGGQEGITLEGEEGKEKKRFISVSNDSSITIKRGGRTSPPREDEKNNGGEKKGEM